MELGAEYDPHVGRFVSKDPIGFAGGDNTNLYAYVLNDQLRFAAVKSLFRVMKKARAIEVDPAAAVPRPQRTPACR